MTAHADARTVFISYASQDAAAAHAVVGALEQAGLSCWIAPRDVVPGGLYAEEIIRAIDECGVLVLLLSAQSVLSPHVGKELERASSKRRRIIALRIDATALPRAFEYFLSESQWIDVGTGGIEPAAAKLADAVRHHLGSGSAIESSVTPALGAPHGHGSTTRWSGKRIGVWAVAVLALLLIAGGIQWARTRGATHSDQTVQEGVTLAVLPFANLSSDPEQEYFSDGLTEEILNQLAQIKDLVVTGRTSSFSFKGKNEDLRVIAGKLGVANLLEGSIRKEGTQLRITAQLINGRDGAHLWSKTYDRELSKVFALQEEVAKDVAQALSIRLDVGEMSRAQGGTTDIEAYDKYLRAQSLIHEGGPQNVELAAQSCREAVALDARFLRGWLCLYEVLGYSQTWGVVNVVAARTEQKDVSARIVSLAPGAWRTQLLRAYEFLAARKWKDAEAAIDAARVQAQGAESGVRAELLSSVGRIGEEARIRERQSRADPLSLAISNELQRALVYAGRDADAKAEYSRSKGLQGDHASSHWWEVLRLSSRDDADPAAVTAQHRVFLDSAGDLYIAPHQAVLNSKNNEEARTAVRRAIDDASSQNGITMQVVAWMADRLGDKDLALAALRRSVIDLHSITLRDLWSPYRTGLRADPRFKEIVREVGLVDYWRTSGNWGDFCKPVGTDDFECH
ncbi:MAG: TIR domain-containing protein [Steroidobacteraceae bacterium]